MMPENFQQLFNQLFPNINISEHWQLTIAMVSLLVVGYSFYFMVKSYVMPSMRSMLAFFKPELAQNIKRPMRRLTDRASLMGPLVFYLASYGWFVPEELPIFILINKVLYVYLYINIALLLNSALTIGGIVYNQQEFAKDVPIKGIIQVIKLAVFIVFSVLAIAELIGKSPWFLLSSLGALTAIILLVFRDTIMGFVAGIQIASHRMVAHGDWIQMPKYGVDGEVLEVGLHTVKVQNFDKTIVTIPTYTLISESFKNWRGMTESGGRRIKRSFLIDINSIDFVDDEKLQALFKEVNNQAFEEMLTQNGCRETNLGLYRQYCEFFMHNHPQINQNMTFMARQLPPSEYGVPLEIYCFSADQRWTEYEKIQAGVIEHLLARLSDFGLRAFQRPADR